MITLLRLLLGLFLLFFLHDNSSPQIYCRSPGIRIPSLDIAEASKALFHAVYHPIQLNQAFLVTTPLLIFVHFVGAHLVFKLLIFTTNNCWSHAHLIGQYLEQYNSAQILCHKLYP